VEATDVLELLRDLDEQGVRCWLDGGWGVDSLLGEQTRPHGDLDVVVLRPDVERVRPLLQARGYRVIRDWLPTALALRDSLGREVDLHPVDPTADGGGDQVLRDGSTWHYAAPVAGTILGHVVRCAPPDDQVLMHQGYELRPVDVADLHRLATRFGPTEAQSPTQNPRPPNQSP
jgi:lincosamide nucleotidyltransferase A/C/D/E